MDVANCPGLGQLSILNLGVRVCLQRPHGLRVPKENQHTIPRNQVNGWWTFRSNK